MSLRWRPGYPRHYGPSPAILSKITGKSRHATTRTDVDITRTYDGTAPSHFFGELTKTPEGCQYLRDQDVVGPLAAIVRQHGLEGRDHSILTTLKCALWALVICLVFCALYGTNSRAISDLRTEVCPSWKKRRSLKPSSKSRSNRPS